MKPEDLLALLLFVGDKFSRPTLANLCEDFEQFEHRHHLRRALSRWEEQGLLERRRSARNVVYTLTKAAREHAQPFGDPRKQWERGWDGLWRLFIFDLPSRQLGVRCSLWRWLRAHRFGYLQDSVWVTPDPVQQLAQTLALFRDNPENFVLMESKALAGGSDAAIVLGAWDFPKINAGYNRYMEFVHSHTPAAIGSSDAVRLGGLIREERAAYASAQQPDPFLPRRLWPPGYLGLQAFRARTQFLLAVGQRVRCLARRRGWAR